MEAIDCIKTRRSVRKFLDKPVSDEIINQLIDAARHAPFGGPPKKYCQPWEFIIVKAEETKEKLALDNEDRVFVKQAPTVIAVCADKKCDKGYKEWEAIMGLAAGHILLAANNLGLGACYVTTFTHHDEHKEDRQKLINALNIPEDIELIALIPIGYPDPEEVIEEKELREINELIHEEKY